jgi:hypothetical protein
VPEPIRPFRWDLVRPDQLGSLLDGVEVPQLFFLDGLVECAARVLAQCGDGELYFVGRSVDSLYDLLSGALADTDWPPGCTRSRCRCTDSADRVSTPRSSASSGPT